MKTAVLFFLIPIVGIAQMNFEKKLPSNAPYQTEIISGDGVSAYGDLDNDGDLDLITTVSAYTVNYTRVYLNENGNFIRQSSFNPVNFNGYSGLVIFDRNQDGNLDFISSGYDSNSSFNTNFYYGDGTGNFTEDPSFNIVGLNAPSILVDDLTGDLKEDILISGTQTG
ncbi:MAG: FG-GAP-like repeat-containing protein, partial [Flavobacteriia bacterium]